MSLDVKHQVNTNHTPGNRSRLNTGLKNSLSQSHAVSHNASQEELPVEKQNTKNIKRDYNDPYQKMIDKEIRQELVDNLKRGFVYIKDENGNSENDSRRGSENSDDDQPETTLAQRILKQNLKVKNGKKENLNSKRTLQKSTDRGNFRQINIRNNSKLSMKDSPLKRTQDRLWQNNQSLMSNILPKNQLANFQNQRNRFGSKEKILPIINSIQNESNTSLHNNPHKFRVNTSFKNYYPTKMSLDSENQGFGKLGSSFHHRYDNCSDNIRLNEDNQLVVGPKHPFDAD